MLLLIVRVNRQNLVMIHAANNIANSTHLMKRCLADGSLQFAILKNLKSNRQI